LGRVVVITGRPSVGKTTIFIRVIDSLRALGMGVGGFVSREVRVAGVRVGFEIMDLTLKRKGWLAHVDQHNGPRIGKYRVNMSDLVKIGVGAVQRAIQEKATTIIAVDEIGPMELTCSDFVQAIDRVIKSSKTLLATVHYRELDQILKKFNLREPAAMFEVTLENRETINKHIVDAVTKNMTSSILD
jgi:nucleoside-triphosphatase